VPASRIATLSSGEFVGVVSDNPDERIYLKAFDSEIITDIEKIKRQDEAYADIPPGDKTQEEIQKNYLQIKQDVIDIIESEMIRIQNDPELAHLIIIKDQG
jgi:hypothetical protein